MTRSGILRGAAIAAGALLLIGLVVASAWGTIVARAAPDRALLLAPWDSVAASRTAERLLRPDAKGRIAPAALATAQADARDAIRRSPVNASAWRTLGYVAAARRDEAGALALFETAQTVSKRDALTQLWLIEYRVQKGDVARALRHYDIALRTAPSTWDLLIPILLNAAGDANVGPPLARLLGSRPPWFDEFMYRLVATPPPAGVSARLLAGIDAVAPLEPTDELRYLVRVFAESSDMNAADRLYRLLKRPRIEPGLVRNPGFDGANDIPPLDWTLTADGRIDALQESDRLAVRLSSEAAGDAAVQRLMIGPGRYRLAGRAGRLEESPPATLALAVRCTGGRTLTTLALDTTSGDGRGASTQFEMPADCAAPTLAVTTRAGDDAGAAAGWIDGIELTRL